MASATMRSSISARFNQLLRSQVIALIRPLVPPQISADTSSANQCPYPVPLPTRRVGSGSRCRAARCPCRRPSTSALYCCCEGQSRNSATRLCSKVREPLGLCQSKIPAVERRWGTPHVTLQLILCLPVVQALVRYDHAAEQNRNIYLHGCAHIVFKTW